MPKEFLILSGVREFFFLYLVDGGAWNVCFSLKGVGADKYKKEEE